MELWKKGGSFANWTLLRAVDLSDGKGGTYHLFELCQEFYSGLALQVGLNHMSALPCSLGVWKDSDGVHINMLTPQFIFSYFFTDMMIDPNNEQQVRQGKLFQVFPTMVYNELAGILNEVIEEVGGKEKFELMPMKMDSFETVRQHIDTWLGTVEDKNLVTDTKVKELIDDWDNNKDKYQIVSVRDAEDYAKGHIPNAINIPWKQALKLDNLKKLDPKKTIITYSERGFSGETIGISLNLLGYKARNIKFGFMDWNLDAFKASGNTAWDEKADNPVEK
jgi:rhodanese-related sulfurtransferase